jgi:hypothetical protein
MTALAVCTVAAQAQEVHRTPLPKGHPLIGAWRIDVPGTTCHEIYEVHADGTMNVTSGIQAASSEFEISAIPSERGFYKWVDKIVKDNGKPDCMGSIMEVGHIATNFILVHPSKRQFLMCESEDIKTCIGPFKRQGSDA